MAAAGHAVVGAQHQLTGRLVQQVGRLPPVDGDGAPHLHKGADGVAAAHNLQEWRKGEGGRERKMSAEAILGAKAHLFTLNVVGDVARVVDASPIEAGAWEREGGYGR